MSDLWSDRAQAAETGRPRCDPRDLLKLYLYGYQSQMHSSRRFEAECRLNGELMWLLGRLYPDHKSIAQFRRMHAMPQPQPTPSLSTLHAAAVSSVANGSPLAREFSTSEERTRRALRDLAAQGLSTHVYGGALAISPASGTILQRRRAAIDRKLALGQKMASII